MRNSRGIFLAVLAAFFMFCILHPERALSQTPEVKKGFYIGTMVLVPIAQDLHHQTEVTVGDNALKAQADMSLDYGIGAAVILGNRISDYVAIELTASWSRQSSDLQTSPPANLAQALPPSLAQALAASPVDLGSIKLDYEGRVQALQSRIDLLFYPVRVPVASSSVVEPYIGGGAGIIRSNVDVDLVQNEQIQGFIPILENLGFSELLPQNIDDSQTDYQLSLRAGLNIPFSSIDVDLGWQFYKTYAAGKDSTSHVVGGVIRYYAF